METYHYASTNGSFNHAQTVLNWDPSSLEIKTRSVEKTLEPLVVQVSKILKQISQPILRPQRRVIW